MGRGNPQGVWIWTLRTNPLPWECFRKRPSISVHPSPEGLELGHPGIPALRAPYSYPLFGSGEPQDVAHDFFIHTGEQLLLGGTQRNAAVGAHESSANGLGSLRLLPPPYLC